MNHLYDVSRVAKTTCFLKNHFQRTDILWAPTSPPPIKHLQRLRSCANTQGCCISWADLAEKKGPKSIRRDGKEFVAQKHCWKLWWLGIFLFSNPMMNFYRNSSKKKGVVFKRSILPLGHCLAITQRFPPVEGDSERLWSLDKHGSVSLWKVWFRCVSL